MAGPFRIASQSVANGGPASPGRVGRPPSFFAKHFQISACFVQGFPKILLTVLWNFKGLQQSQTEKAPFPNFCLLPRSQSPSCAAKSVWIDEAT
jgi:hypothetical protein